MKADNRGIYICGDAVRGRLTTMTAELLQKGRELSDILGVPLFLQLLGDDTLEAAEESIILGADSVFLSPGLPYCQTNPESLLAQINHVISQVEPSLILFGQTDMGRDMAPLLASRLDASICMDCVQIEIDPKTGFLLQTKPVYGGNATAVWISTDRRPQILTLRPRSAEPAKPDSSRKGEIHQVQAEIDDSLFRCTLLKTAEESVTGIKLEEAKVIVAGGGGIGGKEGFGLIEELAGVLRGAVGASRVPCDEGWVPKSLEIGQTGRMVSPDLYIAVGISGAPQHLAGCSGSKNIVAINRDPEAHIFKEADFGIVGDFRQILPPFIEKIKSTLGT